MRGFATGYRHLSSIVGLLLVVGLVGAVGRAAGAASRPAGALAPQTGVLLGAHVDPDGKWTGNADALAETAAFEAAIGRTLDINHHYYAWTDTFPSGLEQADLEKGRIPLISWHGPSLGGILSGQHDSLIAARADGLASLGQAVFLRWCWEMNGNWYACDGLHNNDAGKTNGPSKFVAAWRHIHDIFEARGATNVVWVWSPNHLSVPNAAWNHWTKYYPGDRYVDWVGIDGYNWGTSRSWSSWTSFRAIVRNVYDDYSARKPIMIAETSSVEQGGSKATWIANARKKIKNTFPSVAAFVWFDVLKENDWRVGSSSTARTAYKALAKDPYFGAGGSGGPTAYAIKDVSASPRKFRKLTRISFRLTEPATVTIKVLKAGRVVRRLTVRDPMAEGSHLVKWNGRNNKGRRVVGWHKVRLRATSQSGLSLRNTPVRVKAAA